MTERVFLIVDDEPAIRTYLRAILRDQYVLEAGNAPEAFGLLQNLKGDIDLLVTDVQMPGDMDGLDLAHAVRHSFPAIPVILMSGLVTFDSAKFQDFKRIQKPFRPETLLALAKAAMDGPKPQNELHGSRQDSRI